MDKYTREEGQGPGGGIREEVGMACAGHGEDRLNGSFQLRTGRNRDGRESRHLSGAEIQWLGSRQCEPVTSAAFIHQTIVAGGTDAPAAPDIGARTKMTLIVASSSPLVSHRAVLTPSW